MKKLPNVLILLTLVFASFLMTSCGYTSKAMSDANARLQFNADDVEISEVKTATAKEKLVLGIDWKRLTKKEVGAVKLKKGGSSLPVIGYTPQSRVQAYAIYKLLQENPGYDAVLYPQFEGSVKGFPGIVWKTNITVKAKLVKVKTN